jgi:hypothetical protein
MSRGLKGLVGLVLASLFLTNAPAFAQKPVQTNVDQRVVVAFRVPETALKGWLPQPWEPNPIAAGPSKDTNLLISFIDRLINHDADGKLIATGVDRVVSIAIPARNPQTGETAPFAVREFNANVQAVPGPYKTAVPASIMRQGTFAGTGLEAGSGSEFWEVKEEKGAEAIIQLRFEYQRGTPARTKSELRLRSPVDPAFFRIYRFDAGIDVVKGVGSERVKNLAFSATGAEMKRFFDGSHAIISVTVMPWYVREVFLP